MCLFACVVYDGVIEEEPVEEFAKQYRKPELEEPYCEPEMLLAPWRYMFSWSTKGRESSQYSLRPKIQVILEFKICPKKQSYSI